MKTKVCNICKIEKSIDEFYKDKSGRLGVRNTCKECSKSYNEKWRMEHPEYSDQYHATHQEEERQYFEKIKTIRQIKDKKRYAQNTKKLRAYKRHLKYGITDQQYHAILVLQSGVCAICHQPEIRLNKADGTILPLAVDHNHDTGEIRGLLCHSCNLALGIFKDDPKRLLAASQYLLTTGKLDGILSQTNENEAKISLDK